MSDHIHFLNIKTELAYCLKSFYSRESGFNEDGGGEVIVNYVITHGEIKPSDGPIFVVDIIWYKEQQTPQSIELELSRHCN